MKHFKYLSIYYLLLTLSTATTINVPGEYTTIQTAIDSSTNGDTVLVQPDTYVENINFSGKNIVLGSLFLTTQDTSYISSTVIDGNQAGSVVTFNSGEDSAAVLIGFKITNGSGKYAERPSGGIYFYYGGGIYCANSSPTLDNLAIIANTVENYGAGFYCHSSSPLLRNILFSNNSAGTNGGGIVCEYNSILNIENVDIVNNSATAYSGGIYISGSSYVNLNNILISNNMAGQGGGLYAQNSSINCKNVIIIRNTASDANYGIGAGIYLNGVNAQLINSTISGNIANDYGGGAYLFGNTELSIINTIFWNNTPDEVWSPEYSDSNAVSISYSDILGGLSGIITNNNCTVNWLDGNIDKAPMFTDTANNNFRLLNYSPCIGAGLDTTIIPSTDFDGNPRPNPTGSNPDIGAYESLRALPIIPDTLDVPSEYSTIQSALNVGDSLDIILVQPGTYYENIIWPETNGIKLISAGDSSNTIIDGGSVSSVIYMNPQTSTIDTTTLIQGFTITGGGNVNFGGGLLVDGANPILREISIMSNYANQGGGIAITQGAHVLIKTSTIKSNDSEYGGALYINGAVVYMQSSQIKLNEATGAGGGLYNTSSGIINLTNVYISLNNAYKGGGIYSTHSSTSVLTNVVINKNTANEGGGVFTTAGSDNFFNNVVIAQNSAVNGGGLYIGNRCAFGNSIFTISGNSAQNGGAIYYLGNSITVLQSLTIVNNSSSGGAININADQLYIQNSNFQSNGYAVNNSDNTNIVSYINNYWGNSSGPYHPSQNPTGQGDSVNAFVNITPWLTSLSTDAPPIPAQNTSVTSTGNNFITLKWDSSPLGDFDGFKVYFDNDTSGYPYSNSIDVGVDTSYTLSNLDLGTEYFLAVTVYDTDGNESWYSNEVSGVTRVLQANNLDVASDEDLNHIITHLPTISWQYFDSMGDAQTHFQVQVSTASDFASADIWESGEIASADTSVVFAGSELVDGSTYYLRGKVGSNGFWSEWSSLTFRMNSEPTVPTPVYPVSDQVSGVPVFLKALNSTDHEDDNVVYSFNLYSDAELTIKLDSVISITEGSDTTTWQVTETLPDNEQYFWTVAAYDGYE